MVFFLFRFFCFITDEHFLSHREVIKDVTKRMGEGMAEFCTREVIITRVGLGLDYLRS